MHVSCRNRAIVDVDLSSVFSTEEERSALVAVKSLDLAQNEISRIQGLQPFSSLTALDLSSNKLVGLKGLPLGLVRLNVSRNNLTGLEGLATLPYLQELDLSHNKLSDVRGVPRASHITVLKLSYNRVPSAAGLEGLKDLQILEMDNNYVCLTEDLRPLAGNRSLRSLTLKGNPCSEHASYRTSVAGLIPSLAILDGAQLPKRNMRSQSPQSWKSPGKSRRRTNSSQAAMEGASRHEVSAMSGLAFGSLKSPRGGAPGGGLSSPRTPSRSTPTSGSAARGGGGGQRTAAAAAAAPAATTPRTSYAPASLGRGIPTSPSLVRGGGRVGLDSGYTSFPQGFNPAPASHATPLEAAAPPPQDDDDDDDVEHTGGLTYTTPQPASAMRPQMAQAHPQHQALPSAGRTSPSAMRASPAARRSATSGPVAAPVGAAANTSSISDIDASIAGLPAKDLKRLLMDERRLTATLQKQKRKADTELSDVRRVLAAELGKLATARSDIKTLEAEKDELRMRAEKNQRDYRYSHAKLTDMKQRHEEELEALQVQHAAQMGELRQKLRQQRLEAAETQKSSRLPDDWGRVPQAPEHEWQEERLKLIEYVQLLEEQNTTLLQAQGGQGYPTSDTATGHGDITRQPPSVMRQPGQSQSRETDATSQFSMDMPGQPHDSHDDTSHQIQFAVGLKKWLVQELERTNQVGGTPTAGPPASPPQQQQARRGSDGQPQQQQQASLPNIEALWSHNLSLLKGSQQQQ